MDLSASDRQCQSIVKVKRADHERVGQVSHPFNSRVNLLLSLSLLLQIKPIQTYADRKDKWVSIHSITHY